MAYDEQLAERVRVLLAGKHGVVEKRMFGGLTFMLSGHMCCGVVKDTLVVRVGVEGYDDALKEPHARPMDFTGKPLKGMVYVDPDGLRSKTALDAWVARGVSFVRLLPPK